MQKGVSGPPATTGLAHKLSPKGYTFVVQYTRNDKTESEVLAWATAVFGYKNMIAVDGWVNRNNQRQSYGWIIYRKLP